MTTERALRPELHAKREQVVLIKVLPKALDQRVPARGGTGRVHGEHKSQSREARDRTLSEARQRVDRGVWGLEEGVEDDGRASAR